jgi:hypothetical protein
MTNLYMKLQEIAYMRRNWKPWQIYSPLTFHPQPKFIDETVCEGKIGGPDKAYTMRRAYLRKENSVPDTTHTRSLQLRKVYLQCKIWSRFNEPLQPQPKEWHGASKYTTTYILQTVGPILETAPPPH